jgi:hypothetical protein
LEFEGKTIRFRKYDWSFNLEKFAECPRTWFKLDSDGRSNLQHPLQLFRINLFSSKKPISYEQCLLFDQNEACCVYLPDN